MRVVNLLGAVGAAALLTACGNVETSSAPDAGTPAAGTPGQAQAAAPQQADPLPPADAAALYQGGRRLAERFEAPEGLAVSQSASGALMTGGPDAASATQTGRTGGASVRLPAALERNASGGRVRVTISARAAASAGSQEFAANYATREVGSSGWTRFALSDRFQAFVFEYDVPPMVAGRGDYVGILPDTSGGGQAVEIAFVAVEVLRPGTAATAEN
jgi:hypothetical protein